jgi:hypothetical protein
VLVGGIEVFLGTAVEEVHCIEEVVVHIEEDVVHIAEVVVHIEEDVVHIAEVVVHIAAEEEPGIGDGEPDIEAVVVEILEVDPRTEREACHHLEVREPQLSQHLDE